MRYSHARGLTVYSTQYNVKIHEKKTRLIIIVRKTRIKRSRSIATKSVQYLQTNVQLFLARINVTHGTALATELFFLDEEDAELSTKGRLRSWCCRRYRAPPRRKPSSVVGAGRRCPSAS